MELTTAHKTVSAIALFVVAGWTTSAYLSRFAIAEEERAQHKSIQLYIKTQELRLDRLYDRQIEDMVSRISVLRARKNKTQDDIDYLRYLEGELAGLKKAKEAK